MNLKLLFLSMSLAALSLLFQPHNLEAQSNDWVSHEATARGELARGELDAAETDFKAALNSADRAGAIEPGVVNCLCGLSLIYHKRGNTAESERLYELAMRDLEGLVGPNSTRFADWMPDLAWLYNEHGKPDKAEFLFKNALAIRKRNMGENDSGLVSLMMQYAKFLRQNGRDSEASALETRARTILRK